MPRQAQPAELSIFQQELIGTWTNQNLPGTSKGDKTSPYSYNAMVLPQNSPQSPTQSLGYILKNFTYYETTRFNGPDAVAVPGAAPNRGGDYQQTPFVLFYDQQVRFAEGPDVGKIVHLENGAWLHLQTEKQQIGPYLYPPDHPLYEPGTPKPQPPNRTMSKQISIPHGVSVLALGNYSENVGAPNIPNAPSVLPTPPGIGTDPYQQTLDTPGNYQNPQPNLTANVLSPLQQAVAGLAAAGTPVNKYIYCQVDTNNGGGVLNIPFEIRKAELAAYQAQYWLLSIDGGANYNILAYMQNIVLVIPINGTNYSFPHPTANVVVRVPG